MQDPNADTEWNDALRRHGILPEKKKEAEITEDDIIKMVDDTIKAKSGEKDVKVSSLFVALHFCGKPMSRLITLDSFYC